MPSPKSWEFWKRVIEACGVLGLVYYCCITHSQWADSNRNFIMDERAWLAVHSMAVPDQSVVKQGTTVVAKMIFNNTGKTVARKVFIECGLEILPSANAPDLKYPEHHASSYMGMLVPGGGDEVDIPENGTVDASQPLTFSSPEAEDLLSGRQYMVTYCKGTFRDMFDKPHWTKTCGATVYYKGNYTTYNYRSCIAYNDTGDGELPPD